MNTLNVGLLVLAALALLGVWSFNRWQQRQSQVRTSHKERHERKEPQALPDGADFDADFQPQLAPHAAPPPMPQAHIRLQEPIDALIDSIVALDLPKPCLGAALLKAWPNTRRVGSKPVLLEGWDEAAQVWEFPQAHKSYSQVQLAVQLDNRLGPLNAVEFSEFIGIAQRYADHDAIQAHLQHLPEMQAELKRALELESFAKEVDVQLEFYVATQGAPWSVGLVEESVRPYGFQREKEVWRMLWRPPEAPEAEPMSAFSLQFDAQAALSTELHENGVHRLQLLLDVPQLPQDLRPFERLTEAVLGLAASLDGRVVDRDGRSISQELLQNLDAQLQEIYQQLALRDLAAGSPQAKRLFSRG